MLENHAAKEAREEGPLDPVFDVGASSFHQATVLHPGRTGGFAATAGQAKIDVFLIGVSDGSAVLHLNHLIDAASRRIHFQVQFAVGGASVQAQAAVDALVQILLLRRVKLQWIKCGHRGVPC